MNTEELAKFLDYAARTINRPSLGVPAEKLRQCAAALRTVGSEREKAIREAIKICNECRALISEKEPIAVAKEVAKQLADQISTLLTNPQDQTEVSKPIRIIIHCPKCGAPVYTAEGFCGVCGDKP